MRRQFERRCSQRKYFYELSTREALVVICKIAIRCEYVCWFRPPGIVVRFVHDDQIPLGFIQPPEKPTTVPVRLGHNILIDDVDPGGGL